MPSIPELTMRCSLTRANCRRFIVLCVALLSLRCHAFEGDRYLLFVGANYTFDDNVFRLPKTGAIAPTKDHIRQVSGGIGLRLPISRQQLNATLRWNQTHYSKLTDLDYRGRSFDLSWLWQAGNFWSGQMGYLNSRTAAGFTDFIGREQNLIERRSIFADANYMLDATHRIEFGLNQQKTSNSADARQTNDTRDLNFYLGERYLRVGDNSIAWRLNYSDTNAPNPLRFGSLAVDNSYKDTRFDLLWDWRWNGVSRINGRASYESRRYDAFNERNFDGLTWVLTYDWTPNEKSAVAIDLRRVVNGLIDFGHSYYIDEGIAIKPRWYISSKLNLLLEFDYDRLDYRGDPKINPAFSSRERKDTIKGLGLTLNYLPIRAANMSISVRREDRTSTLPGIDYDSTVLSGSIDFTF